MNFVLPAPPSTTLRFGNVEPGEVCQFLFDSGQYWTTSFDPVISATISVGPGLSIVSAAGIVNSEVSVQVRGNTLYTETKICCRVTTQFGRIATRCAAVYIDGCRTSVG
jgi:hypothetical protein